MSSLKETLSPPATMTKNDRCDKCGAQAQHEFVLRSGKLLMCAHHAKQHAPALAKAVSEASGI